MRFLPLRKCGNQRYLQQIEDLRMNFKTVALSHSATAPGRLYSTQVGPLPQERRTCVRRKRYGVFLSLVSAFRLASRAAWIISLMS